MIATHTHTNPTTMKGRAGMQLSTEIEETFRTTYDGSAACVRRLGQQYGVSGSTIRAWAQRLQLTKRSRPRSSLVALHPSPSWHIMPDEKEGPSRPTRAGIAVDALQAYLRDMEQYPRLNAQEEIQLGERIAQGDQEAKQALIQANLRLVVRIAKYYMQKPHGILSLLDLIQEGAFGLIHAVDIFDVRRGWRFSTAASWWIRQAIGRAVQEHSRAIRVPFGAYEQLSDLYKLQQDAEDEELTLKTMAERLSISEERVQELISMSQEIHSLDAPHFGSSEDLDIGNLLEAESPATSPQDYLEILDLRQQLKNLLYALRPRDRRVIILRFGLDGQGERTLETIGQQLHVTRECVRQIEKRVLLKLRKEAETRQLRVFLSA